MKLYHFTDKKNLKAISPNYFGKNCYTSNDKNISNVKRAFYYDKKHAQEYLLNNCEYRYTIDIDKNKIYDLTKDKNNLIDKYNDIDKILRIIKKNYQGAKYDCGFQCYVIFKAINVINERKL